MSVSREEFDKQTQAILDALEGFDATLTKLKMDLGKNPIQKFTGADEYAAKLDWNPPKTVNPNVKPYEVAEQTGGEAFEGLKALIKLKGQQVGSKTASYWLMYEDSRIARRKK